MFNNLLEEFEKAIPFLTIDQSNELQTKVSKLENEKDKRIRKLEEQLKELTKEDNEIKALRAEFDTLKEALRMKVMGAPEAEIQKLIKGTASTIYKDSKRKKKL